MILHNPMISTITRTFRPSNRRTWRGELRSEAGGGEEAKRGPPGKPHDWARPVVSAERGGRASLRLARTARAGTRAGISKAVVWGDSERVSAGGWEKRGEREREKESSGLG